MVLLGAFLAAVFVGVEAQVWKRRTGAGWGFLTFLVTLGAWLFFTASLSVARSPVLRDPNTEVALVIMAVVAAAVVIGLVVATLPKRRS